MRLRHVLWWKDTRDGSYRLWRDSLSSCEILLYSPNARTITHLSLELFQLEVKIAFHRELRRDLHGTTYWPKKCYLKCSILCLKQSSRQWNLKYQAISSIGFEMLEEDYYLYVQRNRECFVILSFYVDDILLAKKKLEIVKETKSLFSTFLIKEVHDKTWS